MKFNGLHFASSTLVTSLLTVHALASTNGDTLIGVGPISRSLGGVGVAAPQEAITAVSANPASLSFAPWSSDAVSPQLLAAPTGKAPLGAGKSPTGKGPAIVQSSQHYSDSISISSSIFLPHVSSEVNGISADGDEKTYIIPAIAWTHRFNEEWGIGLAAYGSAGLGVDYRDTAIDNDRGYNFSGTAAGPFAPLASGTFTELQFLKIVPAVAYRFSPQWSLGISGHVDYAKLDLGNSSETDWGLGFQPGITFHPTDNISLGATYTSAQKVSFDGVVDFNGDRRLDDLTLETPQQVAVGAAVNLFNKRLLLETNVKWLDYSDAEGYGDFGWKDIWSVGVGAQYQVVPGKLALRAGYNFGTNPVKLTSGFNGAYTPGNTTSVQGKAVPRYYYETFRNVGLPAVVEHHVTVGFGYQITPQLSLNVGYTHAFENSVTTSGSNVAGRSTKIKSSLSEDSIEVGLGYNF